MKIAILTLPLNDNYGGILQAYALREALTRRGHEVLHIEEDSQGTMMHWSARRFYGWWYTHRLLRQLVSLWLNKDINRIYRKTYDVRRRTTEIRRFVRNNVPRLVLNKFENLKDKRFDCLIVGSDQIWRPLYYNHIEDTFLSFAQGWHIKKMAYAPSFGVEHWEFSDQQTKQCALLLQQFNAISVREDEGVKMCREKFSVDAVRLLDPTMLLNREAYEKLIGQKTSTKKGQLTAYILDMSAEKRAIVERLQAMANVQLVELGLATCDKSDIKNETKKSIEQWLKEFMQAEFIFTDSFHGCVFAILFHKPFMVYGNKDRGMSRFNTLLRVFELEDRLVFDNKSAIDLYNKPIDWKKTDAILQQEIEKSFLFMETVGL